MIRQGIGECMIEMDESGNRQVGVKCGGQLCLGVKAVLI
jgi:hypothetical protein